MKLITKLLMIVFGSVVGMVLIGGFAVTSLRSTMLKERQQSMHLVVRMAAHQVEHYIELEKSGKLSREDAQTAAKDALRSMRDGENYVFVRSGDKLLMTIVHPDPRKEGMESDGGILANGQSVTDVYLQAIQNTNFAFVSIYTKRPTGDVAVQKVSAIQRIPEWNWMIGSGDFVDDIDKAFFRYLIDFLIIGGVVLACVALLAFVLARGILKQLGGEPVVATEAMRKIANGDLTVEIELSDGDNNSLMASLKMMQMKLKNITSAIHGSTSSLDEQIQAFSDFAKTYAQSKLEEDMNVMLQSIQKLWKTVDILVKSVSRLKR
jgi:signal transduction histidine kinase